MPAATAPTRKARSKNSAPAPDPVPTSQFLSLSRVPEVMARLKVSRTTLYGLIAKGIFPRPVKVGRSTAFVNTEVDAFIVQRMQSR